MDKPWFEDDYFWQAYAPLMFNEDRWADAPIEAERSARLLRLQPGSRLLDLCPGVGRHAMAFARLGHRVTGVDRTEPYLEAARETAEAEGLEIEFVRDDVRRFVRPEFFDGAVNLFSSFGYFEDETEEALTVRNVARSLKSGGRFLIDVIGKEIVGRDFKEKDWFEEDGMLVLAEYEIRRDWTRLLNRWIIIRGGEKIDYSFSYVLYSAEELTALLLSNGFSSVEIYGGLDGSRYDRCAKRLVAVGIK